MPVAVDDATGYRYYAEAQVADAVLVRRLRATDMPVEEIRELLAADQAERTRLFELHVQRVEGRVESLRRSVEEARSWMSGDLGPEVDRGWRVPAGTLLAALDQVAFAVSDDERRPELTGVLLEVRDGSLRLVATDRYRLALRDLPLEDGGEGELRALLARQQVDELRALCAQSADAMLWLHRPADRAPVAAIGSSTVDLPSDDDRFPDYEELLSGLPTGQRTVTSRRPLTETLGAIQAATATLTMRPGAIDVASDNLTRSLPADWEGEPQQVVINPGFLSQALTGLVGPDVIIEVSDPLRPVILRSADTGTFTVWTMPIRPSGD